MCHTPMPSHLSCTSFGATAGPQCNKNSLRTGRGAGQWWQSEGKAKACLPPSSVSWSRKHLSYGWWASGPGHTLPTFLYFTALQQNKHNLAGGTTPAHQVGLGGSDFSTPPPPISLASGAFLCVCFLIDGGAHVLTVCSAYQKSRRCSLSFQSSA